MKKAILILLLFLAACSVESKAKTIEGKVSIPNNLANKVGASDILYILAYPALSSNESHPKGSESRPALRTPLAVHKIAPVIFPVKYEISQEDIVFPEKKFEGLMEVGARLHKDPESNPSQKGEFEGLAKKNPVQPGSKNIDIILENAP